VTTIEPMAGDSGSTTISSGRASSGVTAGRRRPWRRLQAPHHRQVAITRVVTPWPKGGATEHAAISPPMNRTASVVQVRSSGVGRRTYFSPSV
jgi:hypothetical protein